MEGSTTTNVSTGTTDAGVIYETVVVSVVI